MGDMQAYSFEAKQRFMKCSGNTDLLSRCSVEEIKGVSIFSATDDVLSSQELMKSKQKLFYLQGEHNHQKGDRRKLEGQKIHYDIEGGVTYHLWTPVQRGKQLRVRK